MSTTQRWARRLPCLSLSFLTLGACVQASPTTTPSSFTAPSTVPQPAHADPLPEQGRVTLAQVLDHAHAHAAEIVRARGRLALGDAERTAASLFRYDPVLDLGLGMRTQAGGFGVDAEVEVSQQIELGRRKRARVEAAVREQALLEAGVDAARWSVHAEVHLAYARALLAEDALVLALGRIALATTLRTMVETKVAAGEEAKMALDVATAELALARSAATRAEAGLETSRLALAQAAGVTDRPLTPSAADAGIAGIDDAARWVRAGREDNVQLRIAALEVEAADGRLGVARVDRRPAPRFGLRYAHEGATSQPGNYNPASNIVMGTFSVAIPVFSGNRGAVARREAEAEVARSQQRALQLRFDQATRIACVRVEAAAQRVHQLEADVVSAFERSTEGIERAYGLGERDFVAVAQSVERLWTAREQVLVARGEYHLAVAELEHLVGPLEHGGAR